MSRFFKEKARDAASLLAALAALSFLTLPTQGAPPQTVTPPPPASLSAPSSQSAPPPPSATPPQNNPILSSAVEKARAFAFQNTHAPLGPLGKLAASQLQAFGTAMEIPAEQLQHVQVADYGTFVMAVTSDWIYTANVSGNQTLRPVSKLSSILQGLDHPTNFSAPDGNAVRITNTARNITAVLGLKANLKNAYCKKEQLVVGRYGSSSQMQFYDGRFFVRLCDDNGTFLHLICDSQGMPIRVDTNIQTKTTAALSKMLYQQLKEGGSFPLLHDDGESITFGTFFSRHEARFETDASAYESRQIPSVIFTENPYHNLARGSDIGSIGYWDVNGRVDGIRGNWDASTNSWQKPDIRVFHHAMESYPMIGEVKIDSNTVDMSFHRDLENCTVGVFLSHGGPINNNFQIDSGKTWFTPGSLQYKYGTGNLRHLIFDTCGAMGLIAETGENGYKSLVGEWLPAKYVSGLRTACGDDGGSASGDCDGWRFFSKYNTGDSIEAAWTFTSIAECAQNSPATIAYGATLEEALTILADGRFSKERVKSVYAVANVWKELK